MSEELGMCKTPSPESYGVHIVNHPTDRICRIEDDVVITKDGILNLTTAPKEPEELEKIISGN